MEFNGNNWRKLRESGNTYTLPFGSAPRCNKSEAIPRLNWCPDNNILNVWYPSTAEDEIDVHRSRLHFSYELKKLLHPKKYFTFVQRDNMFNGKYAYTVDYYAEIECPPDTNTIMKISSICDEPILL